MKRLLSLILLVLVGFTSQSQIIQKINAYGYGYKRTAVDSVLIIPRDTIRPPTNYDTAGTPAISFKNGCLYIFCDGYYQKVWCKDNQVQLLTIVQQPQSITVNPGDVATFSVTAAGGTPPYTYQWYKNGFELPGFTEATLSFTTIESDEGSYSVVVSDQNNAIESNVVTLTINDPTYARFTFSSFDPYDDIVAGNDIYSYTSTLLNGTGDISLSLNSVYNEKYWIIKIPVAIPAKTTWYNTPFNNGTIPDQVFREPIVQGGFRYYITRIPAALDPASPVILQD